MPEDIYHGEDREAVYDSEINPLVAKITEICDREGIPFVASFQYNADSLCTSARTPEGCSDVLLEARRVVLSSYRPTVMLTTRDGDGNITDMTAII